MSGAALADTQTAEAYQKQKQTKRNTVLSTTEKKNEKKLAGRKRKASMDGDQPKRQKQNRFKFESVARRALRNDIRICLAQRDNLVAIWKQSKRIQSLPNQVGPATFEDNFFEVDEQGKRSNSIETFPVRQTSEMFRAALLAVLGLAKRDQSGSMWTLFSWVGKPVFLCGRDWWDAVLYDPGKWFQPGRNDVSLASLDCHDLSKKIGLLSGTLANRRTILERFSPDVANALQGLFLQQIPPHQFAPKPWTFPTDAHRLIGRYLTNSCLYPQTFTSPPILPILLREGTYSGSLLNATDQIAIAQRFPLEVRESPGFRERLLGESQSKSTEWYIRLFEEPNFLLLAEQMRCLPPASHKRRAETPTLQQIWANDLQTLLVGGGHLRHVLTRKGLLPVRTKNLLQAEPTRRLDWTSTVAQSWCMSQFCYPKEQSGDPTKASECRLVDERHRMTRAALRSKEGEKLILEQYRAFSKQGPKERTSLEQSDLWTQRRLGSAILQTLPIALPCPNYVPSSGTQTNFSFQGPPRNQKVHWVVSQDCWLAPRLPYLVASRERLLGHSFVANFNQTHLRWLTNLHWLWLHYAVGNMDVHSLVLIGMRCMNWVVWPTIQQIRSILWRFDALGEIPSKQTQQTQQTQKHTPARDCSFESSRTYFILQTHHKAVRLLEAREFGLGLKKKPLSENLKPAVLFFEIPKREHRTIQKEEKECIGQKTEEIRINGDVQSNARKNKTPEETLADLYAEVLLSAEYVNWRFRSSETAPHFFFS